MNSKQRRKVFRKTGKIINMNTVVCPDCESNARPTEIGYFCSKCQLWGNDNNLKLTNEKI